MKSFRTHLPRLNARDPGEMLTMSECIAESNDQDRFNNAQLTQILKVL